MVVEKESGMEEMDFDLSFNDNEEACKRSMSIHQTHFLSYATQRVDATHLLKCNGDIKSWGGLGSEMGISEHWIGYLSVL